MRPPSLPLSFLSSEIFSRCNLKWGGGLPPAGSRRLPEETGQGGEGPSEAQGCSQLPWETPASSWRREEDGGGEGCCSKGTAVGRTWAEGDAVPAAFCLCVCVCPCVRLSPAQLRAGSSLVGTGREGVGLVPDSDLQLSGSRLFPSNSAWIPHTEPKCQFTALSPAPFP